MSESIISRKKVCYICNSMNGIEEHHIFFGKNRRNSEKDGLKVYLCNYHHRGHSGVHGRDGHKLDVMLKSIAEESWLKHYDKTTDDFIKRYGKNYL